MTRHDIGVHAAKIASELLGAPDARRSTRTELRFDTGTYGTAVCIAGQNQGMWFDHDADEGGRMLDLIARQTGNANGEVFDWLRGIGIEPESQTARSEVATYDYNDAAGKLLFQVVRYEPKDFRQRRPDGGGWIWNVKGIETVPYRLPDLVKALLDKTIYVVEGEKDVDALRRIGLTATCNPGGKLKWPKHFARWFAGRRVAVIPDNDADGGGLKHARDVAAKLRGVASVTVTPCVEVGKDVSDWIAAGADRAAIERLAAGAEPQTAENLDGAKAPETPGAERLKLVLFDEIELRLDGNYFVKGVLGEGQMSVVYGESGGGKTFFALDLALHVAAGMEWRGRRVRQGGVVYVAAEGGYGISNRVVAFKRRHDLSGKVPFAAVPCSVDLLNPGADTGPLIDLVKVAAERFGMPVKLVVVDTLSRAMAGGNENAPNDMGAYVMNIDRIREVTGAHVMNVHHSGKDTAKGARGHSLLRAATDTEIEVSRDSGTRVVTARVTKQKEMPTEGEFPFKFDGVELGQDEDGDLVTSCVVTHEGDVTGQAQPKVTGKALLGFRKLADCINTLGIALPPSRYIPPHVTGVTLDQWRKHLLSASIISRDGNPRQEFKRIKEKLQEEGLIAIWEDHVWMVKKASHSSGTGGGFSVHAANQPSHDRDGKCDAPKPCDSEENSESVTSVTSRHMHPCVPSRHVTSPYKGGDGCDATDAAAENAATNEPPSPAETLPAAPAQDDALDGAEPAEPDPSPDGSRDPPGTETAPPPDLVIEEYDP
jgi:hypothetical protein